MERVRQIAQVGIRLGLKEVAELREHGTERGLGSSRDDKRSECRHDCLLGRLDLVGFKNGVRIGAAETCLRVSKYRYLEI